MSQTSFELVELVFRDPHHQVRAEDATAHSTAAQEREISEHLPLGDVSSSSRQLSDSFGKLLVVGRSRPDLAPRWRPALAAARDVCIMAQMSAPSPPEVRAFVA